MNFKPSAGLAAALCLTVAACYPYEEHYQRRNAARAPQQKTAQQDKLKQEELRQKQEQEIKQAGNERDLAPENPVTQNTPPGNAPPPNPPERRPDYPFANKVPGKDGFVFSPYNNKVVDVRDIPSGTLVQDPTYLASEKKYFRVP